jgi:hypothetical protein
LPLLAALTLLASLLGGLAKGPWWFWLVGGGALAILGVTDPARPRVREADLEGAWALPLLWSEFKIVSAGWIAAAGAFAAGSVLSWALL